MLRQMQTPGTPLVPQPPRVRYWGSSLPGSYQVLRQAIPGSGDVHRDGWGQSQRRGGSLGPNPVAFSKEGPRKGEQASDFGTSTPSLWDFSNSWSHKPMANLRHLVAI